MPPEQSALAEWLSSLGFYLQGRGTQALFAIERAVAQLGYRVSPEVYGFYQVRETLIARAPAGLRGKAAGVIGALLLLLGFAADIAEEQRIQEQLEWLRLHDPVYYQALQCELTCA